MIMSTKLPAVSQPISAKTSKIDSESIPDSLSLLQPEGSCLSGQQERLGDKRLPAVQRQRLAHDIARLQGNHHLQQLLVTLPQAQPAAAAVQRQGGAAAGSAPAGVVDKGQALQARAQAILTAAYGSVRKIVPGKVDVVDDATLRQRFDDFQIRKGTINPKTQESWKAGDAYKVFPVLEGFADRDNQTIYVQEQMASGPEGQISVAVHEMLHINAAGGFAGAVGADIDEGTTEYLTIQACKKAGVPIQAAYGPQVGLVTHLGAVIGESTLTQAYFGGASILISTLDAVRGQDTFSKFQQRLRISGLSRAEDLLKPPRSSNWVKEKIRIIEDILNEWWVSDADVNRIKTICGTLTAAELAVVREAVAPQVTKLTDHGQRAQVRLALGVGR
jgi:hypothetical protein